MPPVGATVGALRMSAARCGETPLGVSSAGSGAAAG